MPGLGSTPKATYIQIGETRSPPFWPPVRLPLHPGLEIMFHGRNAFYIKKNTLQFIIFQIGKRSHHCRLPLVPEFCCFGCPALINAWELRTHWRRSSLDEPTCSPSGTRLVCLSCFCYGRGSAIEQGFTLFQCLAQNKRAVDIATSNNSLSGDD